MSFVVLLVIFILYLHIISNLTYFFMKKSTLNSSSAFKVYCSVFGHQYSITKEVTNHIKEYTCKCCKKQLTTNGNGKLIELTPKFKEINFVLETIYTRRMSRINSGKAFMSTMNNNF